MQAGPVGSIGECGNCGRPADDLEVVRRVWVHPQPVVADEVEAWCASCRSQYPHQPQGS